MPRTAPCVSTRLIVICARLSLGRLICPRVRLITAKDSSSKDRASAALSGVAVPAFMSALSYYDAYRSARLPANLLQAQRDYFGAHTYQRIDKPGKFHTRWGA